MPHPPLAGGWAEQRALRLLMERGWRLRERNWRCRWGELDLLLEKPDRLLLVEVKGRRSGMDGWGVAALRRAKRQRLERTWRCWQMDHIGLPCVALLPAAPHACNAHAPEPQLPSRQLRPLVCAHQTPRQSPQQAARRQPLPPCTPQPSATPFLPLLALALAALLLVALLG